MGVVRTGNIGFKFHYLAGFILLAFVIAAVCLTGKNGRVLLEKTAREHEEQISRNEELNATKEEGIEKNNTISSCNATKEEGIEKNNTISSCNLFSGRWVYDNMSCPLYKGRECSFMEEDFACDKYGRKDLKYQNWRWQPHHCDLPRFNGTALMEKIKGKKLIFVGDSLNRNQWTSMLCLIESSISVSSRKSVLRHDNLFVFQDREYNASIGFYWSPFLVESNNDDPYVHRLRDRVIRIKAIENHARHWNDADILVFDSFMWWLEPTMTILWGPFGSSDAIYNKVDMRYRLYEMGLNTWSDWLEFNINRTKTKLFFMSLSPYHVDGESWGAKQNCYNETEPVFKEGYWGFATDAEIMHVAESAIQKLETRGLKVEYLNITQMSDYRKDGHPSIYRKFFHSITEEQLKDPKSYSDCIHWCLPGVPDVWNTILYAYILNS